LCAGKGFLDILYQAQKAPKVGAVYEKY